MKIHPLEVEGYSGSLEGLAQRVCSMRYDKLADFFGYCAVELLRQANADMGRGRKLLAIKLTAAWGIATVLHKQCKKIFALCKPYMEKELAEHPHEEKVLLR